MALKQFDDVNPRTRDKNWKEDIALAQMPKMDEYYSYRIVGGVFTYAQHWIEFVSKDNEKKRYPVDCANWDPSTENTTKKGNCPCCELGQRPSVRYMVNVIDRASQDSSDPIRALDVPPTVMRQIVDLKKLNMIKGQPFSVAHSKYGCDIHLMKQRSKKRGGVEWQVQKGERSPLSEEEQGYNLIDFEEYWIEPDVAKIREDLKRHGGGAGPSDNGKSQGRNTSSNVDDDDFVPPKKAAKKPVEDDDEDFVPPKRAAARPTSDDDDDFVPPKKAAKKPVEDDDEDFVPPKKVAKKPVADDDDDFVPPKKAAAAKPAIRRAPADDDGFSDELDE